MSQRDSLHLNVVCLLLTCFVIGCSSRLPTLKPPKFDPESAAKSAMAQYDADNDGKVDKAELKSAPGLSAALDRIDENGDGAVEAVELSTMIQEKWLDAKGGIIIVGVKVFMNNRPLDGATVTFEPEEFLGGVVHPATGLTDADGFTPMELAKEHRPHENVRAGVAPGLYLVRISKEVNGKELIPAKYNEETTLGVEVAVRASYMPGSAEFRLRKR